jgi:ArsR family transcriptional regulator
MEQPGPACTDSADGPVTPMLSFLTYQCCLVCSADVPAVLTQVSSPDLELTLAALADPLRWRIVCLLAREELCTTHLQAELGAKQTLVSHHLKVLREAGLVSTSPCGRFTYYRLTAGALDELRNAVAGLSAVSYHQPARRAC